MTADRPTGADPTVQLAQDVADAAIERWKRRGAPLPTGADDLAARLELVGNSVGPACSVFLAFRDEPILYGSDLIRAAARLRELEAESERLRDDAEGWRIQASNYDHMKQTVGRLREAGDALTRKVAEVERAYRECRDRIRMGGSQVEWREMHRLRERIGIVFPEWDEPQR